MICEKQFVNIPEGTWQDWYTCTCIDSYKVCWEPAGYTRAPGTREHPEGKVVQESICLSFLKSPRKVPWDRQIFWCRRFPPGHIRGPRLLRECPPSSRILYLEDYSVQQLSNKILLIFHKADLSCIGLKISSLNVNSFSHNHIVVSKTDKKMTKSDERHNKTFTFILYHPFQN